MYPKQWTSPPWQPVLRDREPKDGGKIVPLPNDGQRADPRSRLYARSAGDDKGSIMAMLAAIDAMRASGTAPSVNLKVFFEGEEEAGSAHLEQILQTYKTQLAGDGWGAGPDRPGAATKRRGRCRKGALPRPAPAPSRPHPALR